MSPKIKNCEARTDATLLTIKACTDATCNAFMSPSSCNVVISTNV